MTGILGIKLISNPATTSKTGYATFILLANIINNTMAIMRDK
jgi:hypothetical protein